MKTAILISGQMRTFKRCYATQKWQIFRHYPNSHFFLSICDDAQAKDWEILVADGQTANCEIVKDPTDLPQIPIRSGLHAPYANAITHDKLMLQHWGNKKVWEFFCASADKESFDVIIRIRPDLWIHRFQQLVGHFLYPPSDVAFLPWWGKFGGVNDRLAILGNKAAEVYFNTYDQIPVLLGKGCPFHPETLVAESLRTGGAFITNRLMTEFSTERMDGTRRWAEIVQSDIAELIASK